MWLELHYKNLVLAHSFPTSLLIHIILIAEPCMATRSMQDIYQSFALDPAVEEIRIVKVRPGFGDDIFCELENLVLPQHATGAKRGTSKPVKANYIALSYMWDYMTPSLLHLNPWSRTNQEKEIYCNGASLTVKPSLSAALRQLWHKTEPKILWTDAICINQEDDDGKTSQVKVMIKTYALTEKQSSG